MALSARWSRATPKAMAIATVILSETKTSNHAWNAVCTDGKWRLLDSCWGAGYCDDQHRFQARFNEHQFAVPPEQFVLTHLPEVERWQLLAEPITLEQFEKTASPKPTAFSSWPQLSFPHQLNHSLNIRRRSDPDQQSSGRPSHGRSLPGR